MAGQMTDNIERYLNYLTVEKTLSINTLDAYKNDLNKFQTYLAEFDKAITGLTKNDIISYLNHIRDSGNQTPTIVRNIASLRGLCKFMILEGIIKEDPAENLGTPTGWKHLPKILGIDDVALMSERPQAKQLSFRVRAIFELLYSSSFCVSETIHLTLGDIPF